jgi:hypothetical protein
VSLCVFRYTQQELFAIWQSKEKASKYSAIKNKNYSAGLYYYQLGVTCGVKDYTNTLKSFEKQAKKNK